MRFVHQPADANRIGEFLLENFQNPWPEFTACVAFVKQSGTKHIARSLQEYSANNRTSWLVGIDHYGTSKEGLEDLLHSTGKNGRVIVFHNPIFSTFHPKLFLFKSAVAAELLVGSGNLTEGGLFTNYEAAIHVSLNLKNAHDKEFLEAVEQVINGWLDTTTGTAKLLTADLLNQLVALGYVPVEALTLPDRPQSDDHETDRSSSNTSDSGKHKNIFSAVGVMKAPAVPARAKADKTAKSTSSKAAPSIIGSGATSEVSTGFLMTLQKTDVGVGQRTPGTSRRSPEIFIPLSARDADPAFWGWPDMFTQDMNKPKKLDRVGVRFKLGAEIVLVNMMTWPDKHDFRLRSEALRSAGNIGDILRIERPTSTREFDYFAVVIPPAASEFEIYSAICVNSVRNSNKLYGYY